MRNNRQIRAIFAAILAVLLWMPITSITQQAKAETDVWDGTLRRPIKGNGSQQDPYQITSAEEFAYLMQNYDNASGVCFRKYYKLMCDINLNNLVWLYGSASTANRTFIAKFDGAGHKISNVRLMMHHSSRQTHAGLFPQLGGDADFESAIENLHVDNVNIEFYDMNTKVSPNYQFRVGALVGQMYNNSRIENCIVSNVNISNSFAQEGLPYHAEMWMGPLVGDMQEKFGAGKGYSVKVPTAKIEKSYGYINTDLSNVQGPTKESVKATREQGSVQTGKVNGYTWHKTGDHLYAFSENAVTISRVGDGNKFQAKLDKPGNYTYRWEFDKKFLASKTNEVEIPYLMHNETLSVVVLDAKGNEITSNGFMVEVADLKYHATSVTKVAGGKSYNINAELVGKGKKDLSPAIAYTWYDLNDDRKEVGHSIGLIGGHEGHTYLGVARSKGKPDLAISTLVSFANVIYVNLHGITSDADMAKYTFDGKTAYAQGHDDNDGKSPASSVRTLARALQLCKSAEEGATIADNVIVIMGDYDENVIANYFDNEMKQPNPQALAAVNTPAIICGSYGNIRNGELLVSGEGILVNADRRYENLTFHGDKADNGKSYAAIYAQNNDITFGFGLKMTGYAMMDDGRGISEGAHSPMISVYGGFLNPDFEDYNYKENQIELLSGYFGRLIAGSRFTKNCYKSGNIAGSPRRPMRPHLIVDICNSYNPFANPFDVALVVGGQADGSCWAISTTDIKGGSRVGRVIGGNIGFGRPAFVKNSKGDLEARPSDSFFGKSTINIESGIIHELYGGNLARNGRILEPDGEYVETCASYFYGESEINIKGGDIRNTIYGAGAGGVMGYALNDDHHTLDPLIPYSASNGKTLYGTYKQAKGKMPRVIMSSEDLIRPEMSAVNLNISGNAHIYGSVYGGGHGFSSQLQTREANGQTGSIFGNINITMDGGIVEGYIFGGGHGSTNYYDNYDLTGYPVINGKQQDASYFSQSAQVLGNINVKIKGGIVKGNIFGAGEGTYYREAGNNHNGAEDIAAVYGSTTVTIDSLAEVQDFVFGGGNYADIRKAEGIWRSGNTYVDILGGKIGNSIFGGGHGNKDLNNPEHDIIADIEGSAHVQIRGGEFFYTQKGSRYDSERFFGIYGSGRDASTIHGDTYVEAHRSLFSQAMLDSVGMHFWNTSKAWDRRFALCGGGFGADADVMGDTYVLIDVDDVSKEQLQGHASPNIEDLSGDFSLISKQTTIPFLTFTDIFGGGLNGKVYGSTNVTVQGNSYIRNIYGGGMRGNCGIRDMELNGGHFFNHSNAERNYTTRSTVNVKSGRVIRVYGGSLMSNVGGETEVNIGTPGDSVANANLSICRVTAGNDVTGVIAGGNNERYGTHLNIYGGTILYDVFGAGDGEDIQSEYLTRASIDNSNSEHILRARPHVASAEINILGSSATDRVKILGSLFCGGNNTTVGRFEGSKVNNLDWGLIREVLVPNSGRVALNIGSHVSIGSLVMGSNGENFFTEGNIPYSTKDGKTWYHGFLDDEDFQNFARAIDMSCVPTLTFNADGKFHNNYPIDDRMGDANVFETPGEMDATDVMIREFTGGGYRGSMTSDSCYIYTLPLGVTVLDQVVGGSRNAYFSYTEAEGPAKGTKRTWIGGITPYHDDFIKTDRLQLNLFNRFAKLEATTDAQGRKAHKGAKIYTGCLDYGIIMGYASLNFHSDLLGGYQLQDGENWVGISQEWNSETGLIYGAGKGQNTEILGNTYINIRGAVLNGQMCIPNCLNVFGGGLAGRVVGRTNVGIDLQCRGSKATEASSNAVWGCVYGGGHQGDICAKSTLMPQFSALTGVSTHVRVHSGRVGDVFGGARMANIEGGTWVEIEDRSNDHFHVIIDRVFGGSDLSGQIGLSKHTSVIRQSEFESNTYVFINEGEHEDGLYTGFPLIGEVFAGGNGEYGDAGDGDVYANGEVVTLTGEMKSLVGVARPSVDSTRLEIHGGTILSAFGGANSSCVNHAAYISIDYPSKEDKAHFDRTVSESCYDRGKNFLIRPALHEGFTDDGALISFNDNICRLYGGNNKTPLTLQPNWDLQRADIGNIYGGCNQGDVLYYNESGDRNLYPAAGGSPGLWLVLCNDDLKIDKIYGGSRMGNIKPSRITYDPATGRRDTTLVKFADNQYSSVILITNGTYGRVFGGNDVSGNAYNGTRIMMQGGKIQSVYGAGNGSYLYKWDPSVKEVTETWDEQLKSYVYLTPTDPKHPNAATNEFDRMYALNAVRPHVQKSLLEIGGGQGEPAYISQGIFSGGNCATVLDENDEMGEIVVDLGDNAVVNELYMGANGGQYTDQAYVTTTLKLNDIKDLGQTDKDGNTMLDIYMRAVGMYGLPKYFHFRNNYDNCYIGSFYLGGRRGSLFAHGDLSVTFPRQLKIFDKVVGGPSSAAFNLTDLLGNSVRYDGGIIWDKKGPEPLISLDVQCQFYEAIMNINDPTLAKDNFLRYGQFGKQPVDANIFSGCYESGKVEGTVDIQVDGMQNEEIFF